MIAFSQPASPKGHGQARFSAKAGRKSNLSGGGRDMLRALHENGFSVGG